MIERPEGFVASHANRGVCGVVAIATAASVSYQVAWATLKAIMQDKGIGQRFRGGTYPAQQLEALSRLAVKFEIVERGKGWKVWEFAAHLAKPDTLYMVTHKAHIYCVRNGWVMDQSYTGPVQDWNARNKRLIRIVEITGKGW